VIVEELETRLQLLQLSVTQWSFVPSFPVTLLDLTSSHRRTRDIHFCISLTSCCIRRSKESIFRTSFTPVKLVG